MKIARRINFEYQTDAPAMHWCIKRLLCHTQTKQLIAYTHGQ